LFFEGVTPVFGSSRARRLAAIRRASRRIGVPILWGAAKRLPKFGAKPVYFEIPADDDASGMRPSPRSRAELEPAARAAAASIAYFEKITDYQFARFVEGAASPVQSISTYEPAKREANFGRSP